MVGPGETLDDMDGLLDWPALQAWLARSQAPGNGAVVAVRELTGGTQNHLFHLTREDLEVFDQTRIVFETQNVAGMIESSFELRSQLGKRCPPPCVSRCVRRPVGDRNVLPPR